MSKKTKCPSTLPPSPNTGCSSILVTCTHGALKTVCPLCVEAEREQEQVDEQRYQNKKRQQLRQIFKDLGI
jgi:hypothetical protein